jgi:hypothetical protein
MRGMKSSVSRECEVWEWSETPLRKAPMAGRCRQAHRMDAPRELAGRRGMAAWVIESSLLCFVYRVVDSV